MSSANDYAAAITMGWRRELGFVDLLTRPSMLDADAYTHLSIVRYHPWLARNPSVLTHAASYNLTAGSSKIGDQHSAEKAHPKPISVAPAFVEPWVITAPSHLVRVLEDTKRVGEALDILTDSIWSLPEQPYAFHL